MTFRYEPDTTGLLHPATGRNSDRQRVHAASEVNSKAARRGGSDEGIYSMIFTDVKPVDPDGEKYLWPGVMGLSRPSRRPVRPRAACRAK